MALWALVYNYRVPHLSLRRRRAEPAGAVCGRPRQSLSPVAASGVASQEAPCRVLGLSLSVGSSMGCVAWTAQALQATCRAVLGVPLPVGSCASAASQAQALEATCPAVLGVPLPVASQALQATVHEAKPRVDRMPVTMHRCPMMMISLRRAGIGPPTASAVLAASSGHASRPT